MKHSILSKSMSMSGDFKVLYDDLQLLQRCSSTSTNMLDNFMTVDFDSCSPNASLSNEVTSLFLLRFDITGTHSTRKWSNILIFALPVILNRWQ